jgi:hypothetical protein
VIVGDQNRQRREDRQRNQQGHGAVAWHSTAGDSGARIGVNMFRPRVMQG